MNRFRPLALGSAIGTVLAVAGCVSRPPLAVRTYVLESPSGPLSAPEPGARVVSLPSVRVNPAFLGPSLVYRLEGDRVEVDPYASLAAPTRTLLTSVIRAHLVREPFVKDVVQGLAGLQGLTVEVVVQEMSGDFRSASAPVGALDLEVFAYAGDPAPGAAPLLRKLYGRREPLGERSAAAVVAAWGRALASILAEVGRDLRDLPASVPAASPAGR
jgi:hypothetical protein